MASWAFLPPVTLRTSATSLSPSLFCSTFSPRPLRARASRAPTVNPSIIRASTTEFSPQQTLQPPEAFATHLTNIKTIEVDAKTGKKATWFTKEKAKIQTAILPLPTGPVANLPISTSRVAKADVFALEEVLSKTDLSSTPFIIFSHGFSQRPINYFSLLSFLATQGYVVIAARVWFASMLFTDVETVNTSDKLPAKLQTAVLIDSARSFQVASDYSPSIHLFGHSMGGAMALVYAGYARSAIQSVGLMAPGVREAVLTELNHTVSINAEDGLERMKTLATQIASKVFIMHGDRDRVVPIADTEKLFTAFQTTPLTGFSCIKRGTHIGFEDSLEVDLPFINIEEAFFLLVDLLFYGLDLFGLDTKEQLETTKATFSAWYNNAADDATNLKQAVESADIPSKVTYDWTS